MCGDQNNDYLRECDFFSLLLLLLLHVSVLYTLTNLYAKISKRNCSKNVEFAYLSCNLNNKDGFGCLRFCFVFLHSFPFVWLSEWQPQQKNRKALSRTEYNQPRQ